MPLAKLVVENAILPLVPPQVFGLVVVPAAMVGADGSFSVLSVASLTVQTDFLALHDALLIWANPFNVNPLAVISMFAVSEVEPFL